MSPVRHKCKKKLRMSRLGGNRCLWLTWLNVEPGQVDQCYHLETPAYHLSCYLQGQVFCPGIFISSMTKVLFNNTDSYQSTLWTLQRERVWIQCGGTVSSWANKENRCCCSYHFSYSGAEELVWVFFGPPPFCRSFCCQGILPNATFPEKPDSGK